LFNVHEINKQDMENLRIFAVIQNGQEVFLSHIFTHLCHSSTASLMMLCSKLCQTSIERYFRSSTSWICYTSCWISPHILWPSGMISVLLGGQRSGEITEIESQVSLAPEGW